MRRSMTMMAALAACLAISPHWAEAKAVSESTHFKSASIQHDVGGAMTENSSALVHQAKFNLIDSKHDGTQAKHEHQLVVALGTSGRDLVRAMGNSPGRLRSNNTKSELINLGIAGKYGKEVAYANRIAVGRSGLHAKGVIELRRSHSTLFVMNSGLGARHVPLC